MKDKIMNNFQPNFNVRLNHYIDSIETAANAWYSLRHLINICAANSLELKTTLEKSPRQWNLYTDGCIQQTLNSLAKIFDKDPGSYSLIGLLDHLRDYDAKLTNHTLDRSAGSHLKCDLVMLYAELDHTLEIWNEILPAHDKVFAHDKILSAYEKKQILSKTHFAKFDQILESLLSICQFLWGGKSGSALDSNANKIYIENAQKDFNIFFAPQLGKALTSSSVT